MDMTDLLDAADSSRGSWRLEPKWLRVTYTYKIAKKMTELLKVTDSSQELLRLEPKMATSFLQVHVRN